MYVDNVMSWRVGSVSSGEGEPIQIGIQMFFSIIKTINLAFRIGYNGANKYSDMDIDDIAQGRYINSRHLRAKQRYH